MCPQLDIFKTQHFQHILLQILVNLCQQKLAEISTFFKHVEFFHPTPFSASTSKNVADRSVEAKRWNPIPYCSRCSESPDQVKSGEENGNFAPMQLLERKDLKNDKIKVENIYMKFKLKHIYK